MTYKISLIAIILLSYNIGYAQLNRQVVDSPENIIIQLYHKHQPQNHKEIKLGDKKILLEYFTPELTKLLLRDYECRKRTHEICNLDFDPILAAQDFDNSPLNLTVQRIEPKVKYHYKVTFYNITRRILIYHLRQTERGWRINDIIYPEGQSLTRILSQ